jgi:hypothetical protein
LDNGHATERAGGGVGGAGASSGVVCGWASVCASVGEEDVGDASEGEKVRLVRLGPGRTKRAMRAVAPHLCREVVPSY